MISALPQESSTSQTQTRPETPSPRSRALRWRDERLGPRLRHDWRLDDDLGHGGDRTQRRLRKSARHDRDPTPNKPTPIRRTLRGGSGLVPRPDHTPRYWRNSRDLVLRNYSWAIQSGNSGCGTSWTGKGLALDAPRETTAKLLAEAASPCGRRRRFGPDGTLQDVAV